MTPADKLLLRLAEAKHIVRRRQSHLVTRLYWQDERMAERDIPATAFTQLLERGYLKPVPQDALFDLVYYEFTNSGERKLRELYEREGERRA